MQCQCNVNGRLAVPKGTLAHLLAVHVIVKCECKLVFFLVSKTVSSTKESSSDFCDFNN